MNATEVCVKCRATITKFELPEWVRRTYPPKAHYCENCNGDKERRLRYEA